MAEDDKKGNAAICALPSGITDTVQFYSQPHTCRALSSRIQDHIREENERQMLIMTPKDARKNKNINIPKKKGKKKAKAKASEMSENSNHKSTSGYFLSYIPHLRADDVLRVSRFVAEQCKQQQNKNADVTGHEESEVEKIECVGKELCKNMLEESCSVICSSDEVSAEARAAEIKGLESTIKNLENVLSKRSKEKEISDKIIFSLKKAVVEASDRRKVLEERVTHLEQLNQTQKMKEQELLASIEAENADHKQEDIVDTLNSLMDKAALRNLDETKLVHVERSLDSFLALVKEVKDELKTKDFCCVCMEYPKSVVFLPCRHLCTCDRCAPRLMKCPICQTKIKQKIETFSS